MKKNKKLTSQDSLLVQHNYTLLPGFITGFSEGESSFIIRVTQNKKLKPGWTVQPVLKI